MAIPDPPRRTAKELIAAFAATYDATSAALVERLDALARRLDEIEDKIMRYHRDSQRVGVVDRIVGRWGLCAAAVLLVATALAWRCAMPSPAGVSGPHDAGAQVELVDARPPVVDLLVPPAPRDEKRKPKPRPRPVPDPDGDVTTDPQAGHHHGTMSRSAECRDTPTPRADCAPVPRGAER